MTDSQKWLTLVLTLAFGFLVYLLSPILMPFVMGFLLAYLGTPMVHRLRHWKVPHTLAVCIVFFGFTLTFVALIGGLVPAVKDQIVYLHTKMPEFLKWINTQAIPWIERTFQVDARHLDLSDFTDLVSKYMQEAGTSAGQVISKIATSGLSLLGIIAGLALIPIVTFYLMLDWDMIFKKIDGLLPQRYQMTVAAIVKECDEVLSAFFRGQFLVMICLSLVYSIGLKIVGLEIGVIIGLMTGIGSIIPYFGFTIGLVTATVAAIFQFQEWLPVLWVWTVFAIGAFLENSILVPNLVGNKVGLHPVAVIFAILAGGELFGFFGMLLAIPVTSVVVVLFRHAHRHYFQQDLTP